ncbi:transposase [Saccharothrix sp. HUAS TT10]|uniref:transposase n=1 Tax=Saccharothrix sp. HUAS TT10 TaxID=3447450 RepID=UPI003F725A1E
MGASQRLLDALRDRVRLAEGRATRGWGGGKKVAGRKRHIVVDTMGAAVGRVGHSGLDAGPGHRPQPAAATARHHRERATSVWADGGYTDP